VGLPLPPSLPHGDRDDVELRLSNLGYLRAAVIVRGLHNQTAAILLLKK
jgi:hypothetical protein